MNNWYIAVSKDLTVLPSCILFYENELLDAKKEVKISNNLLEGSLSKLPGIVEHRFGQLQEIEAILELLHIQLKKLRSNKFKTFLESYNKTLSSRDAEKYIDGEQDIYDMTVLVNEFALVRNMYLAISKGLDQKSYMIGHITRLRCAGLDDARID